MDMTDLSTVSPVRHQPVLLNEVMGVLQPQPGETFIDGTFGAGGYSRALLEAGARVFAIDRDPDAIRNGTSLVEAFPDRLTLIQGRFGAMAELLGAQGIDAVDGVVLDIGVSSMHLDEVARGFSFLRDGPLDMRMEQAGESAADVVNTFGISDLTRIIGVLGEEPRARAVARAIIAARDEAPITTTHGLVSAIEDALGPRRADQRTHPATHTFQGLRLYVNRELEELADGLHGAETLLRPGGRLAIVSFHSLEDRIAKRFFNMRSGSGSRGSRHAPAATDEVLAPRFSLVGKGHIEASPRERSENPRSRSAKLRAGVRLDAPASASSAQALGVPLMEKRGR